MYGLTILATVLVVIGLALALQDKDIPWHVTAIVLLVGSAMGFEIERHWTQLNKFEVMEQQIRSSNIESQESLTNGFYAVLAVHTSPTGGYLAVLQPAIVISIDLKNEAVVYTNVGKLPRLVNLDTALRPPSNSTFLAMVGPGHKGMQIWEYNPFRKLPGQ